MAQQRQDGPGEDAPHEGERSEQDVTEQRVEVEGSERQPRADVGAGGTGGAAAGTREGGDLAGWFTSTAVRLVLAIVGLVVVLFALGQVVGIDLLGLAAEALSSEIGRWLVIAAFGLLLIGLAQRGFRSR
jgi:hypothetical protein